MPRQSIVRVRGDFYFHVVRDSRGCVDRVFSAFAFAWMLLTRWWWDSSPIVVVHKFSRCENPLYVISNTEGLDVVGFPIVTRARRGRPALRHAVIDVAGVYVSAVMIWENLRLNWMTYANLWVDGSYQDLVSGDHLPDDFWAFEEGPPGNQATLTGDRGDVKLALRQLTRLFIFIFTHRLINLDVPGLFTGEVPVGYIRTNTMRMDPPAFFNDLEISWPFEAVESAVFLDGPTGMVVDACLTRVTYGILRTLERDQWLQEMSRRSIDHRLTGLTPALSLPMVFNELLVLAYKAHVSNTEAEHAEINVYAHILNHIKRWSRNQPRQHLRAPPVVYSTWLKRNAVKIFGTRLSERTYEKIENMLVEY